MNIQAIRNICMAAQRVYVWTTEDGQQWIGDGACMYSVESNLQLNRSNFFTIFNIPKKQIAKMTIHFGGTNENDNRIDANPHDADTPLKQIGYPVLHRGDLLYALTGPPGLVMINSKYLQPVENEYADFMFYIRREKGFRPYVIVCVDGLAKAIITPFRSQTVSEIQDELRKMCTQPDPLWKGI